MAEEAIQNTRANPSEVFKLAGQSLPPELFDLVRRNLSLADVGPMRQTASAVADVTIDKHLCRDVTIDFNLTEDSTDEDVANFEAQTLFNVQDLMRECKRINENIKRLSVNFVDEGTPEEFFNYVDDSTVLDRILTNAEELFIPYLDLNTTSVARRVFGNLSILLKLYPNLTFVVGLLVLRVHTGRNFKYRDRVVIERLTCAKDITTEDIIALTSNPVQSIVYSGQNEE
jgi:hypothetical protein